MPKSDNLKSTDNIVRIFDILSKYENLNKNDANLKNNQSKIDESSKVLYNSNYWTLKSIYSDVLEFVVNSDEPNKSAIKMYIIPNPDFNYEGDDNTYFSVVTISYNSNKKSTQCSYSIDNVDNINKNYNIDVLAIIEENYIEQSMLTIDQNEMICDIISTNINIIKAACTNEETLRSVVNQLLLYVTQEFDIEFDPDDEFGEDIEFDPDDD